MTGDESGRRTRRPDVLGSLPGAGPAIDPAVLEEIRSGIADILRKMDAVAAALPDGRAEPVTEALEAAVEDAVKKIVAARPPDAGTGEAAAIASRADGMETAAARMEAGAARMEAAAERTENRLEADLKGTAELLAGDPWEIGSKTAGIESAAARIEEGLKKWSNDCTGIDIRLLSGKLDDIERRMRALRFGWRAFLSPWMYLVLVLGMLIESRILVFSRWL